MTFDVFIMLLGTFSIITGLLTEGVKKIITDKKNISYNILALCISLIIGCAGTAIYYLLNNICFNINNIIYIVLMGFASGLISMVGYDKVKQTILQIVNNWKKTN